MMATSALWLVIMLAVVVVLLLYRLLMRKGVKTLLAGSLVVLGSFVMYAKYTCSPDPKDVAVMKPMAEKISDYIVKHGIPKSLKDIPELPYALEGCERSEEYLKSDNRGGWEKAKKEHEELYNIDESCSYKNIKVELGVSFHRKDDEVGGRLVIVSSRETVINMFFRSDTKGNFVVEPLDIGSYKTSGICNPMRQ